MEIGYYGLVVASRSHHLTEMHETTMPPHPENAQQVHNTAHPYRSRRLFSTSTTYKEIVGDMLVVDLVFWLF
jgi:hypothetical protein